MTESRCSKAPRGGFCEDTATKGIKPSYVAVDTGQDVCKDCEA